MSGSTADVNAQGPVIVRRPDGAGAPVLFDSPHSGTHYPADFNFTCPFPALRQAEDTHVDALIAGVSALGVTVVEATFPRSYIDANRAEDDIDMRLIDGAWPHPLRPTEKSDLGMGLIRRLCRAGLPMYDRRLTAAEVRHRIHDYYRPYHAALKAELDRLHTQFGAVWHVDCHSMPSFAGTLVRSHGGRMVDFVLGNRDGRSCSASFLDTVHRHLRGAGFSVAVNELYKGVEIVSRYGRPVIGAHSLQLEINRGLYMNEQTLEPHGGFDALRGVLEGLAAEIVRYGWGVGEQMAAE